MATLSSTLSSTEVGDQLQTIKPLLKIFLSLTPMSITMTHSQTNPVEHSIFVSFSFLNISKANGTTPFERLQLQILSFTLSTRTLTTLVGCLSMDFFLQEGRMAVESVHMFPMKQRMKETTLKQIPAHYA